MTISGREHDALRESLGVLALGRLDERERRPVLAHADACPECGALLDDFLEMAALLAPVPAPRDHRDDTEPAASPLLHCR